MDETLELFSDETSEILNNLNENLMQLEKDTTNIELINEIFRHAHTLKGMSSAVGFSVMAKLTHEMEDLMDKIRSGDEVVTEEKVDIFLQCTELLEDICSDYLTKGISSVDITEIVSKLKNTKIDKDDKISKNISDTSTDVSIPKETGEYIKSSLELDGTIPMPGLRAFIFLNKVKDAGLYISSCPTIDECKDDSSFNGLITLITSGNNDDIVKMINNEFIFESFTTEEIKNKEPDITTSSNGPTIIEEDTSKKKNEKSKQSMRIQSDKIDSIINLVAELVIEKNKLELLASTNKADVFAEPIERLDRVINQLQGIVMNVRMIPVASTFKIFPKEIRKVSKELNKKINLSIHGEDTELDRSIVDHIKDPLIHIIRNSLDHGLESTEERIKKGKNEEGSLSIIARYEGNQVIIEVIDDGKGIDGNFIAEKAISKGLITEEQANMLTIKEKVNLICAPGFSTAEKVTSLSGRGVGLDAVKNFIENISGTLEIDTIVGEGTTVRLFLPLTLGIIQAMLIKVGDERYAVPLFDIETIIDRSQSEIRSSHSKELLIYKEKTYPIVHLTDEVNLETDASKEEFALLVKKGSKNYALMVHSIVGQQEIVIKTLGETLKNEKKYSGATILGDGLVSLILDVGNIIK